MLRKAFIAKINSAVVTKTNVDYEGSIEIDSNILEKSGIMLYECVWIWNVTNGNRLMTYVLESPSGSGDICPNGAAALLCSPGDKLVITAFAEMTVEELKGHVPTVINLGHNNFIASIKRNTLSTDDGRFIKFGKEE